MQLREGVHVYTWDNQDVGHIDRFVMNPISKEVTHVVIRQGFLFTEDKVVPMDLFASADDERAVLRQDIDDLDNLPPFEEKQFVSNEVDNDRYPDYPADASGPLYWYPPAGVGMAATYHTPGFYAPTATRWPYDPGEGYIERTEQNIPDDTVAIKDGADVISSDGKHVGDVERVFVDTDSNYATHIVISQGLFFKERKLVPTLWLSTVLEDEVHLGVDSDFVDRLPAYEDEPSAR